MVAFFCYEMNYYVYILKSEVTGIYYKGVTQDITNRLQEHNSGEMKFTKAYVPWILVGYIEKPNRSQALILERKLKNLSRERLELFIDKYCK